MATTGPTGAAIRRPSSGWAARAWLFLTFGALIPAVVSLSPPWLRMSLNNAVAALAIAAVAVGARRHLKWRERRPWWLVTGALVAFWIAGMARFAVPGLTVAPSPATVFIPKFIAAPGYAMLAWALMILLRRRRTGTDDPALTDALLIGTGLASIVCGQLAIPAIEQARVSTAVATFAGLFPAADVLVMVVLAFLLLSHGPHPPAMWLLTLSISMYLAADLAYLTIALAPRVSPGVVVAFDALLPVGFVATGAAALHPSTRLLAAPPPKPATVRRSTVIQGLVLTVVIAAPAVLALLGSGGAGWSKVIRTTLTILFAVMIAWRIGHSAMRWRAAEADASWRAAHDPLTGLSNGDHLDVTLTEWCQRVGPDPREYIRLLLIDIDQFRNVLGIWGRSVGDELLRAVAQRLTQIAHPDDLVCRLAMDKFVVLSPPAEEPPAEEPGAETELARRIIREIAVPFALSVGPVRVTVSIGLATTRDTARDAQALIHAADTAMFDAKDAGKNTWRGYDPTVEERVRRSATLERALRAALDQGELSVHYQPIVDLRRGCLSGFEALMRWTSPDLGQVSPTEFIPIAEYTGVIVTSGAWLLERAASQTVTWNARRPPHAHPLHVSVNLSSRQLRDPALVDQISTILIRTGLPTSALWLEITESRAIDDPKESIEILRSLRDLGITICVDDFGTGYSTLSYLTSLPASVIKIDRSLTSGIAATPDAEAVVHSVISMAHILDRTIVAEGVETATQHQWLQAHGCDFGQGYFYGPPRDARAQSVRVTSGEPWNAALRPLALRGERGRGHRPR